MASYKKIAEDLASGRASFASDSWRLSKLVASWEEGNPKEKELNEATALLTALFENSYDQ